MVIHREAVTTTGYRFREDGAPFAVLVQSSTATRVYEATIDSEGCWKPTTWRPIAGGLGMTYEQAVADLAAKLAVGAERGSRATIVGQRSVSRWLVSMRLRDRRGPT